MCSKIIYKRSYTIIQLFLYGFKHKEKKISGH